MGGKLLLTKGHGIIKISLFEFKLKAEHDLLALIEISTCEVVVSSTSFCHTCV